MLVKIYYRMTHFCANHLCSILTLDMNGDIACPNCVNQMHKDPTSGELVCQKHSNQIPTPW